MNRIYITAAFLLFFALVSCQVTVVRLQPESDNTELQNSKKYWGIFSGLIETSDPLIADCPRPEKAVIYMDGVDSLLQFFQPVTVFTSISSEVYCKK